MLSDREMGEHEHLYRYRKLTAYIQNVLLPWYCISVENEDLRSIYQIVSANIHGSWDHALYVKNPKPGLLDFRGYPNKKTLYLRAVEVLDDATLYYMKLWNEIADAVGADGVYYEGI